MKTNAIMLANYFVDKYNSEKETCEYPLDLLRIVKYVYISYGYALAILDRCVIDTRFDKVEAWRYGPVIPSVYHSFKYNRTNPITEKSVVVVNEFGGIDDFKTPELDKDDRELRMILDFVWNSYKVKTSSELIDILHQKNTPWSVVYEDGLNKEIPQDYTKLYYSRLFEVQTDSKWKSRI